MNKTVDLKDKRLKKSQFSLQNIQFEFNNHFRSKSSKKLEIKSKTNSQSKKRSSNHKFERFSLFSGDRMTRNRSISLLDIKLLNLVKTPMKKISSKKPKVKINHKVADIILPLSIQKKVYEVWEELGDCVAFLYTGSKAHNVKKKDKIKTLLVRYYKNNFSDYNRQKILDRLVNMQINKETYTQRSVLASHIRQIMTRDETLLRNEFNLTSGKENRWGTFITTLKNRYIIPMVLIQSHPNPEIESIPSSVINAYVNNKFQGLEKSKLNSDREVLNLIQTQYKNGILPMNKNWKKIKKNNKKKSEKKGKNSKKKKLKSKKQKQKKQESKFIYEDDFFEEIKIADLSEQRDHRVSYIPSKKIKQFEYGELSIMNESNMIEPNLRYPNSENSSYILSEENSKLSLNKALGNLGIENDQGYILKTQIFK
jgi:hypothetical protein